MLAASSLVVIILLLPSENNGEDSILALTPPDCLDAGQSPDFLAMLA
jgi:hypothetical protein